MKNLNIWDSELIEDTDQIEILQEKISELISVAVETSEIGYDVGYHFELDSEMLKTMLVFQSIEYPDPINPKALDDFLLSNELIHGFSVQVLEDGDFVDYDTILNYNPYGPSIVSMRPSDYDEDEDY